VRCAVIQSFGKEIDRLVIQERDDLVATGENIRVRVSATAMNRADLLQRRGLYPAPAGAPQDIPGLEFVGYVDQLGECVTDWTGDERVLGILPGGGYAEQVLTHQRLAVSVPEGLSDAEAAAIPEAFMVAHDALVTQGAIKSGDVVLIHAVAGGIGTAAVQLAHQWNAQAIGTAGSAEKLGKVSELTPFLAVNYKEEDFQKRIEEAFGKNAVDLILDTVGASYWGRNIALLKDRGRIVILGLLGGTSAETPLATVLFKRLRIMGTTSRGRPLEEKILATQAFAREVLPLFRDGRLRPVIDSVFPLDQLHEATARMESNQNVGKIVLTVP
jgi:putative PIG3 family NAD(P)H quinone oxidoreductase